MTQNTDKALVERLRTMGSYPHKPYPTHFINPDGPEAATRLDTLTRENAELVAEEDRLNALVCSITESLATERAAKKAAEAEAARTKELVQIVIDEMAEETTIDTDDWQKMLSAALVPKASDEGGVR
jgi:hypothetical protein